MTLKDISHGPDVVIWIVFVIFLFLSLLLLSGRGANLIAGYNTASKEEKAKTDEKKLCRVVGAGFWVITIMILIMGIWEDVRPSWSAYAFLGGVFLDCTVMLILANTVCRK